MMWFIFLPFQLFGSEIITFLTLINYFFLQIPKLNLWGFDSIFGFYMNLTYHYVGFTYSCDRVYTNMYIVSKIIVSELA